MKKILSGIAAAIMIISLSVPVLAASVTLNGTVVNAASETVTAPLGGTVKEVLVAEGDQISAGTPLAVLETEKTYALQDGTVRLFGQIGDSAEMTADRYGAVAYIEPDIRYSISASTKSAYDLEENKIIHPGEILYLRCAEDSKHTGKGIVTSVSGTSFEVEVISGSFLSGESVFLYRSKDYPIAARVGKGDISLKDPIAYTGEGILVNFPIENGTHVSKGNVLFETLSGSYANQSGDLTVITADTDGVVSSISLKKGDTVSAGAAAAELWADQDMRLQASVTEEDLQYFSVGDTVRIEFIYLENGEYTIEGTIEKISRIGSTASDDAEEASFTLMIVPAETDQLLYGMTAMISRAPQSESQPAEQIQEQTEEQTENH